MNNTKPLILVVIDLNPIFYYFIFDIWRIDISSIVTICCVANTTLKISSNNSKK